MLERVFSFFLLFPPITHPQEHEICKRLGVQPIGIESKLPTEEELDNFKLYIDKQEVEKVMLSARLLIYIFTLLLFPFCIIRPFIVLRSEGYDCKIIVSLSL